MSLTLSIGQLSPRPTFADTNIPMSACQNIQQILLTMTIKS